MKRLTARPLSPRRSAERGFVLLLVFAMAAGIAIMLYLEMPRIAFQHQRTKEAMLVDRGEQYKRALELYVKKYNRFPQTIDELEKPDNIRLLRRRYKDPMTGKDEWRLIHIDNSGQYIDSLVHKKEEEKKERHLLEADVQGVGASASSYSEQQGGATPFLQRTASDRILPGSSGGDPGAPPPPPQEMNPELSSRSGPAPPPQADPGQPMAIPGQMMGSDPGAFNPARPAAPGGTMGQGGPASGAGQFPQPMPGIQPLQGQQPAQGQQSAAGSGGGGFGFGGGFGMGSGGSAPAAPPTFSAPTPGGGMPNPQMPGVPPAGAIIQRGGPQPGVIQPAAAGQAAAPATANEALRMIQQQLTRPTPQAAVVRQGGAQQTGQQQGTLAGGLAGVASTLDLEGILVYNERTNYKEWEFLADLKKIRGGANTGAAGGQPGQPGGGQRGGGQQGQPGMQGAPGFGGSGFGGGQGRPGQQPGMGGPGGAGRPATPPGGGFGFGGGAAPPKR